MRKKTKMKYYSYLIIDVENNYFKKAYCYCKLDMKASSEDP